MNWDQIETNWLHFKNKLRHNWVKLTDEDITRISGRRNELVARLQDRYGFARIVVLRRASGTNGCRV